MLYVVVYVAVCCCMLLGLTLVIVLTCVLCNCLNRLTLKRAISDTLRPHSPFPALFLLISFLSLKGFLNALWGDFVYDDMVAIENNANVKVRLCVCVYVCMCVVVVCVCA
jgi:hypothetical protein